MKEVGGRPGVPTDPLGRGDLSGSIRFAIGGGSAIECRPVDCVHQGLPGRSRRGHELVIVTVIVIAVVGVTVDHRLKNDVMIVGLGVVDALVEYNCEHRHIGYAP